MYQYDSFIYYFFIDRSRAAVNYCRISYKELSEIPRNSPKIRT